VSDAPLFELLSEAAAEDGGRRFLVRFPAGSPAFEGHFPDDPVVPAAVQLDVVAGLVRERAREPRALRAVSHARFLEPLRPGDPVEVSVGPPTAAGRRSFALARDGRTLARGTLDWGDAEP